MPFLLRHAGGAMIKAGVYDVGLCHARALKEEGHDNNRGVACCACPVGPLRL